MQKCACLLLKVDKYGAVLLTFAARPWHWKNWATDKTRRFPRCSSEQQITATQSFAFLLQLHVWACVLFTLWAYRWQCQKICSTFYKFTSSSGPSSPSSHHDYYPSLPHTFTTSKHLRACQYSRKTPISVRNHAERIKCSTLMSYLHGSFIKEVPYDQTKTSPFYICSHRYNVFLRTV